MHKGINKAMDTFIYPVYSLSFRHTDLEGGLSVLYWDKVFHLSEIGLDILNLEFKTCIELAAGFWGVVGCCDRWVS